ncbi:2-succinyl-6-hydroxy-2,4-cyclohexadiene-1-carboxylate synthase [Shewanella sp. Scap07]|uniref:2-succinyl-6-hydroxy-2, 4-cyclohexadiene-1-carboxylate synthase n=1 Tax=Shewanella sp. Scap07 TaxID=2589987 RepID=UPI0015BEEF61|nr:2-succinyl-6-hydroxy-2,4-cyclohexadiene-1-carboxylate synthase [Shewanella sp. Scap07]QLE87370.1 2-succinyl-6-hydroxy-2,4-cyclohexadiene-1-carboxylate synthase [Shewanella sp. Scap07]
MATHINCFGQRQQPALVMLHGFLGSQQDWQATVAALSEQFYCICIDLPGHGHHPPRNIDSFDDVVSALLADLHALGVSQFHLLGYSLGGRIALHIAKRTPQQILSLHLESCHPGLIHQQDRQARAQSDALWAQKLATLPIAEFLQLWYQQGVFAELSEQQRRDLVTRRSANDPHALAQMYRATSLANQQDLMTVVDSIIGTSHFYVGDQDAKFLALGQRWQQQTQLHMHIINAAGHNAHLAQPTLFNQTLLAQLLKDA